jgi:hypothetical protein
VENLRDLHGFFIFSNLLKAVIKKSRPFVILMRRKF